MRVAIGAAIGVLSMLVGAGASGVGAQDAQPCPLHARHAMEARGAEAMGFDQARATHHFHLTPDGGFIQVEANDGADALVIGQITAHLQAIREQFASGDYRSPRHTHGEDPPGVPALERLRARIVYAFEGTPRGGRVVISSSDTDARAAIHEFLRYQIREHSTGDPLTVERR